MYIYVYIYIYYGGCNKKMGSKGPTNVVCFLATQNLGVTRFEPHIMPTKIMSTKKKSNVGMTSSCLVISDGFVHGI